MPARVRCSRSASAAGGERGGVDAVHGRVQLDLDGQLLRRPAPQRRPGVQPAGQPVAEHGVGAEPGRDVCRVERGERAEAAQPEPAEELDERGAVDVGLAVELLHAERGEEGGGVAGRDGHRTAGGQHGGEQPVGEPRPGTSTPVRAATWSTSRSAAASSPPK